MMAGRLDRLAYPFLRLGWVGAAGAVLLLAVALLDGLYLRPLEAERAALAERNALAAVVRPVADDPGPTPPAVAAPLAETAEATLRHLFAAARQAGLRLDQGDYQLRRSPAGNQGRYQLTLPVQGSYPAIRDFIAGMLNDDPALALVSVEMNRPAIESTELDATLHFVLHLKEAR